MFRETFRRLRTAFLVLFLGSRIEPENVHFTLTADTSQFEATLMQAKAAIEDLTAAKNDLNRPQLLIKFHRRLSSEAIRNVADALHSYQNDPSRSFILPSEDEAAVYQLVADRWEPL